jgi:CheY-like chemotaxis protein
VFPTVSPEAYPAGPDGVRGALWRSLAVFRWVALGYAAIAAGVRLRYADRPVLGLVLIGVMAAWSVALTVVIPPASRSRPRLPRALALADLAVCAALPDGSGVEVIRALLGPGHESGFTGSVLVVSASGEQADVLAAVKSGASGYLVKSARPEELVDAVRRTADGVRRGPRGARPR